jgi:hypothetical protein
MRANARVTAAVVVALAVLGAGIAFAVQRPVRYVSKATLALAPAASTRADRSAALDSFTSAGTSGTFVELLASGGTVRRAGFPPVALSVRAVPDTRVIVASATGSPDAVQPGLASLVAAAKAGEADLGDVWQLVTLSEPSTPVLAGAGTVSILFATLLLAVLAGVATLVALSRLGPPGPSRRSVELEPLAVVEKGHVREGARGTSRTPMAG